MASNKRRLEQMIAAGTYVPPPILAADGKTNLRDVLVEWNAVAGEMATTLSDPVDESSADEALPRVKKLAKAYQSHYNTVWQSGVEVGPLREIVHGHNDARVGLESALRTLKFERRSVFDRLSSIIDTSRLAISICGETLTDGVVDRRD